METPIVFWDYIGFSDLEWLNFQRRASAVQPLLFLGKPLFHCPFISFSQSCPCSTRG